MQYIGNKTCRLLSRHLLPARLEWFFALSLFLAGPFSLFLGPDNACGCDNIVFVITHSVGLGFCACETNGQELESLAWMSGGKLLISTCAKHSRGDTAGAPAGPGARRWGLDMESRSRSSRVLGALEPAGPLAREMLGGSFCCRDKNQTDVKAGACGGADAEVVFGWAEPGKAPVPAAGRGAGGRAARPWG